MWQRAAPRDERSQIKASKPALVICVERQQFEWREKAEVLVTLSAIPLATGFSPRFVHQKTVGQLALVCLLTLSVTD